MLKKKHSKVAMGKKPKKARSVSRKIRQNKWTVIVYLGGDNNLAEEMVFALKSMELVGSQPPEYEVFALYDGGVSPVQFDIGKRQTGPSNFLERAEKCRSAEANARIHAAELALEKAQKDHNEVLENARDLDGGVSAAEIDSKKSTVRLNAASPHPRAPNGLGEIIGESAVKLSAAKRFLKQTLDLKTDGPDPPDPIQSVLAKFVIRTIEEHPAQKYMLILSGHGSGAVGDFLTSNSRFTGLSIPDLKDALSDVQNYFDRKMFMAADGENRPFLADGRINILGMDSCLMGMAEVAFEVRDYVDYLVGPEGFEPNTGWPYDEVLSLLKQNPTPRNLARQIVDKYIAYYSSDYTLADVSTDQTALDLTKTGKGRSKIEKFVDVFGGLDGLSGQLIGRLEDPKTTVYTRNAVVMAHWRAQGYKNEQHVDVFDFCELLQEHYDNEDDIWKACDKVKKTIEGKDPLVLRSSYCGPAFQHSHGISIFFPWANITDAVGVSEVAHYRGLAFSKEHYWDEFLKSYHAATQREVRKDAKGEVHDSTLNRREGLFTGPPPEDSKAVGPNAAFKAVGPNAAFKAVGPNAAFKAVGPNAAFKAVGPNAAFKAVGPNAAFKMSGGLISDSLPKIASMKNPAVEWKDLD